MSKEPFAPLDTGASHHLSIQSKIEEMAATAGVSAEDRLSLETLFVALPRRDRRRVRLFLEGVKAQSDSQAIQQAAQGYLDLAAKAWGRSP